MIIIDNEKTEKLGEVDFRDIKTGKEIDRESEGSFEEFFGDLDLTDNEAIAAEKQKIRREREKDAAFDTFLQDLDYEEEREDDEEKISFDDIAKEIDQMSEDRAEYDDEDDDDNDDDDDDDEVEYDDLSDFDDDF